MRILLVEDDTLLGEGVRDGLALAGYAVDWARDGATAGRALADHDYDACVLDLGLPKRGGLEVLRELRERGGPLPVLVLTARDTTADKVAGLDAGADDYLTKPFGGGALLARVRVLLRRRSPTDDAVTVHRFGEVEVDIARHTVRRGGEDVHLTQIEHRLLAVMLANAGKVLTHRHLMREVWGPGHAEQEHYVRIYIRRLRQKLEGDPTQPRHLLTETGVGYRFQPGVT